MRWTFENLAGFVAMLFERLRGAEDSAFQSRTEGVEEGNAESQTGQRRSPQREPITQGTTKTLP